MTNREKVLKTFAFENVYGEGPVLETVYPWWDQTVKNWTEQGLPAEYAAGDLDAYEGYLGFDGLKRINFGIPYGRYCKQGDITDWESWKKLKEQLREDLESYWTYGRLEEYFGCYREGHERGDFSIQFFITGFFWFPRDLFGIEEHLYAFYDEPELMHDMNQFLLEMYLKYLPKITDMLQPELIYISEDLSGKNGPMLSPDCFEEFVASYYRKLIPVLKEHGVKNIFVDTDGDFRLLIPNFMAAGVEGFLPVDVNAGVDIVDVRREFPTLKFMGGFNKLAVVEGKEAIDREFERLLPVIRQGGYIPGIDHQAAPNTPYENYVYYIGRLKEIMKQAAADCEQETKKSGRREEEGERKR